MDFDADLAMPLGGRERGIAPLIIKPWVRSPGSWSFIAPSDGVYGFHLWAPGGAGDSAGGGAGGQKVAQAKLLKGASVFVSVGKGAGSRYHKYDSGNFSGVYQPSGDTYANLPDGVARAIAGTSASGPTAGVGGGHSGPGVGQNGGSGGIYGVTGGPGVVGDGLFAGTSGTGGSYAGGGGSAPGESILSGGGGGSADQLDWYGGNNLRGGDGKFPGGGGSGQYSTIIAVTGAGADGVAIVTYDGPLP